MKQYAAHHRGRVWSRCCSCCSASCAATTRRRRSCVLRGARGGPARGERPFDALGEKGEGREGRRRGQTRSDQRRWARAWTRSAKPRRSARRRRLLPFEPLKFESKAAKYDRHGWRTARAERGAVRPSSGRPTRVMSSEAARHAEAPAAAAGCGRACARDRARVRGGARAAALEAHRLHNPQAGQEGRGGA